MSEKRILIEETDKTQSKNIKLDKEILIKNTLKTNTNSDITKSRNRKIL